MLVRCRTRQQRQTSQLLASSFAQLQLPWLAPAQLRWNASHAPGNPRPTTSRHRPSRSSDPSRTRPPRTHTRALATATEQYSVRGDSRLSPAGYGSDFSAAAAAAADNNIPWDFSRHREPIDFPHLGRQTDPPIMIDTTTLRPATAIKVAHGPSGTVRQLLAHLHTSLQVGRQKRAEAIVQRVSEQCGPSAPESIWAHETLLEHMRVELAAQGRDSSRAPVLLSKMQKWFEIEVRNKGIHLSPLILVIMLRAAIRSLDGSKRDRSIRRYVDLSEQLDEDARQEVLNSSEFDDNEHAILGRSVPEYMDNAEELKESVPVLETQAMEAQGPEMPQPELSTLDNDLLISAIPEVRPTEQKGTGLASIKKTMETLTKGQLSLAELSSEERRTLAESKQWEIEGTSATVAIEQWKEQDAALRKIGILTSMQTRPVGALMWEWYKRLLPALKQELKEVRKVLATDSHGDSERRAYGPYLELLPLNKVAANTILFTMSKLNPGKNRTTGRYEQEVKLGRLTTTLASAIEAECVVEASSAKPGRKGASRSGRSSLAKRQAEGAETESKAVSTVQTTKRAKKSNKELVSELEWPLAVKVQLGAMLISKLIESAHLPVTAVDPRTKQSITQMQPAFLHRVKFERGRKVGMVTFNPDLVKKLQSEPVGSVLAKRMPMIVEPRPWKGWSEGGYLRYPNPILRLPQGDNTGKDYFDAADRRNDLSKVYEGLNALGKVPWKVHQGVFQVQLEAWNSGEAIANFAPLDPQFSYPVEPEEAVTDLSVRRKYLSDVREIKNKEAGNHSKRCFQNFQLEVARTLVNETLYFPHNLDFRGRAYPIPPYLNHMGADNVRGLLVFAEGKELGEGGLRWLKIHLATVAGHDKASMDERLQFTEAHLDDIFDSVQRPLDGRRWWLKAEDAWQTLAACFELASALQSPDPTKFVSHLPIQQDGTCNGLQHYAALGGDKAGAEQVNLEPGERPADVYTAVLTAVEKEVEADAKAGNPIAEKLHGRLTRKCVKQPVMTNVYGVTFYGARLQVAKQLHVLFPDAVRTDDVNVSSMAHYIATKIFKSLGTMFAGAQSIQTWLGQCADRISTCLTPEQIEELKSGTAVRARNKRGPAKQRGKQDLVDAEAALEHTPKSSSGAAQRKQDGARLSKPLFKSTVIWTTPLRLPVVQPYRKAKTRVYQTNMQYITLQDPQVWDPVSKRKQLQAFPPNFIHSLDATHMLLSAMQCTKNDMTFASIHDSFWTHACDVHRMSDVLREAFVAMHREDIIGRLREEFEARYKGCMYLATVSAHSPVGRKVAQLRVDMKKKGTLKTSELILEAERMRLCNSQDPKEREKGEAMVTPGSILSSEADEAAFSVPVEMAGQVLGNIPGTSPEEEALQSESGAAHDQTDLSLESDEGAENTLNAFRESGVDEAEAEATESSAFLEGSEPQSTSEGGKKANAKARRKLFVWLPLTFPEVPKKGDFKVERLLQSRYFFH